MVQGIEVVFESSEQGESKHGAVSLSPESTKHFASTPFKWDDSLGVGPLMQSPVLSASQTNTPQQYTPLSPTPSPSYLNRLGQEPFATILLEMAPEIQSHPRPIRDIPLPALHVPQYEAYHLPPAAVPIWDSMRFQGRKLRMPAHVSYFSTERAPPAWYAHWKHSQVLSPQAHGYIKALMGRYTIEQILEETLWGMREILKCLRPPNFIQSLDVVVDEREYIDPHFQGRTSTFCGEVDRFNLNSSTSSCGHTTNEDVTVVITISTAMALDPLDTVSTIVHEMGHAISPCPFGVILNREPHDNLWVNSMAVLLREMHRMPHGPALQELRRILLSEGLTWTDVINVYPYHFA